MDKTHKLTHDELQSSLIHYANGKTTTQIINMFIETHKLENTDSVRASLRLQLRSVNPKHKQFATLKYGMLYDLAREAAMDVFKEKAYEACSNVFSSTSETLNDLQEIKRKLRDIIKKAKDIDIEIDSNSKYLNSIKVLASIPQIEADVLNARANLINQLNKFIDKI